MDTFETYITDWFDARDYPRWEDYKLLKEIRQYNPETGEYETIWQNGTVNLE